MITFPFPDGFLFGTGSSAFQVEGSPYADGKSETIWDYMCRVWPEKMHGSAKTEPASSFYKNYEKDITDMKEQGLRSFRFSISWARILPDLNGTPNPKGIEHYNRVIDLLLENGIEPFVDLYHWDTPMALENAGGMKTRQFIDHFLTYAKVCFENFGDRVRYWSTFNEPSVFCYRPYAGGAWYPFERDFPNSMKAAHYVLLAHFRTVRLYRAMGLKGKIGMVTDISAIYPKDPTGPDVLAAQYQYERGAGWWLDPIFKGRYPQRLLEDCPHIRQALPEGFAEELEREFAPSDMIGINYYFPGTVEYREDAPEKSTRVQTFIAQTDERFVQYPPGLYDVLMFLTARYDRPEIFITENGLGKLDHGDHEENINDDERVAYLRDHLRMVSRSIAAGADVKGYYYWSHFDSLESLAGYQWRFGLTYVDYESGNRERKKSWYYYKKICESGFVD